MATHPIPLLSRNVPTADNMPVADGTPHADLTSATSHRTGSTTGSALPPRDLRVLSEWETVGGYSMPQAKPGPATQAVTLANGVPWEELKDDQGRAWVSWPMVNKVRHTW